MTELIKNKAVIVSRIKEISSSVNSLLGKKKFDENEEKIRKQEIEYLNKLLITEDLKLAQEDLIKERCISINSINLAEIIENFNPSKSKGDLRQNRNQLPQMVFLGNSKHLSLSDQRHTCKSLGFEYYENTPFGITNDNQMTSLAYRWSFISDYTKLIIIGDAYNFQKIKRDLYKKYWVMTT